MARGTLTVRVVGDTKPLQKSLKGISGIASGAAKAIAGVGVAAGVGLAAATKAAIGMNSTLENAEMQFATLLGSADEAKKHVADLFEFAAKTPFETEPILTASRHLQIFGGDALNTEENLTLIGNSAAALSQNMDEVAFWTGRAYSAIQGGQPFGEAAMRLQEMGVLTPEVRQEMEALQDAGASSAEVWGLLEQRMGEFDGAMEMQSQSWSGLISTIKDNLGILNAEALRPLFDLSKDLAGSFAEWLQSKEAERFAKRVSQALQGLIDRVKGWADWLRTGFGDRVRDGMSPLEAAVDMVKDLASNLRGMIPSSVTGQLSGITAAFAILAGPMGLIVRELLPALKPIFDAIVPHIAMLANDLAPKLAEVFAVLATEGVPILVDILGKFAELLREHPELITALIAAWAAFKGGQMVIGAFTGITKAFGVLKTALMANPWLALIAATVALVVLVVKNWDTIVAALKKAWDWIKETAAAVGTWFKEKFQQAVEFVKTIFLNFTGPGLLIKHWDAIKEGIANVTQWFRDKWNATIDFFKELPGRIGRAARGMWDGIKDAFRGVINSVIGWWNGLSFDLRIPTNAVTSFFQIAGRGFTLNTPDIPKLHTGGIFRASRPGGEGLALLKDGERVLSPSQSRMGGDITVMLPNYLGSKEEVARAIRDELAKLQRRNASVGFA